MSPEAFNIRKIKMIIETSTNMPTRNWFKLTCFVDLGMALSKDEGWGMKDKNQKWQTLPFTIILSYSSLILRPSSFLSVSAKKSLNIWIPRLAQSFIGTAKNYLAVFHHHHFAVG